MKRNLIFAVIALMILLASAIIIAQGNGRKAPFMKELTEAQRTELRDLREDMREDGASREDIREAVHFQLEEWGIEVPEMGEGHEGRGPRAPFMEDLTEDQRAELRDMIEDMREDGASREDIREAVHSQLEEWGIEVPEMGEGREGRGPRAPFMEDLTEDQRTELRDMIEDMREDGASREDIREAVHSQLEEWGIEVPEMGEGHEGRGPRAPFMEDLSEDQRTELREMIDGMREDGASREDIREAVHAQLEEWGIEVPEMGEGHEGRGHRAPFMEDLSEDQRTELRDLREDMREDGASRGDIREAVHSQLEEWGIEVPEMGEGHEGRGHHAPFMEDLSEDQRAEVRELVRSMRDDGASREDIRDAVRELIEGWGIDIPSASQGIKDDSRNSRRQFNSRISPSPAKQAATIDYEIDNGSFTEVCVYNVNGKKVKTLYEGSQNAGSHSVTWDGTNSNGRSMPSGTYLVKINSGKNTETQKLILMK